MKLHENTYCNYLTECVHNFFMGEALCTMVQHTQGSQPPGKPGKVRKKSGNLICGQGKI